MFKSINSVLKIIKIMLFFNIHRLCIITYAGTKYCRYIQTELIYYFLLLINIYNKNSIVVCVLYEIDYSGFNSLASLAVSCAGTGTAIKVEFLCFDFQYFSFDIDCKQIFFAVFLLTVNLFFNHLYVNVSF